MEDGRIMEWIWRHLAVNIFGFEGDLSIDTWLHSGRQAGHILGYILAGKLVTYLATFGADFDECFREFEVWPSAARVLSERCPGAGPAECAKPETLRIQTFRNSEIRHLALCLTRRALRRGRPYLIASRIPPGQG